MAIFIFSLTNPNILIYAIIIKNRYSKKIKNRWVKFEKFNVGYNVTSNFFFF